MYENKVEKHSLAFLICLFIYEPDDAVSGVGRLIIKITRTFKTF